MLLPTGERHVDGVEEPADAGHVGEDARTTDPSRHVIDGLVDRRLVGDVALVGKGPAAQGRQRLDGLLHPGQRHIEACHLGAFDRHADGRGPADARGRAGDDGGLPLEAAGGLGGNGVFGAHFVLISRPTTGRCRCRFPARWG